MTAPNITPDDLARWKVYCTKAIHLGSSAVDVNGTLLFLSALIAAYERVVGEVKQAAETGFWLSHGAYDAMSNEIDQLRLDRDRLTAQLALEQTASNRTIEHLVAKKDALEEQYRILSEQSRITLEVAAKRQETLEAQVRELEGDYRRIIFEVLACNPRPASSRSDDQLEPPWQVIARVRGERDALRAETILLRQELDSLKRKYEELHKEWLYYQDTP